MQFLTSLFGASGNEVITALFALGIVLVLILLGVWLLKMAFRASTTVGRGRTRRLSVVENLPVDTKRQLLIVRRDDVEHLILVGGPQDLLVESGFAAEAAPARPQRRPFVTGQNPRNGEPQAPAANTGVPAPALSRPAEPARRAGSLRHTGLLRPGEQNDVSTTPGGTDNSAARQTDSAKKAQLAAARTTDGTQGHAASETGNDHGPATGKGKADGG